MNISDAGIALIKAQEGFSAKSYKCPAGKLTIGFGHTGDDFGPNDTVTRERATQILMGDIKWAQDVIVNHVKVKLIQCQFDALVSFIFNVGETNFRKSTLLKLLNKGRYDAVPAQLMRWNKVNGVTNKGLSNRRRAEVDMWMLSDVNLNGKMPQHVDSPDKSLAKSRTMANGGVLTALGSVGIATPFIEPAGQVAQIAQDAPKGFFIVFGIVLVCGLVAWYLRWDDTRGA